MSSVFRSSKNIDALCLRVLFFYMVNKIDYTVSKFLIKDYVMRNVLVFI